MTVDSNSIYYTLSTIAQTLAGALAVLVAVVLFRYSLLGNAIEAAKAEMRARNIDTARAWPVLRDAGLGPLVSHLVKAQYLQSSWSEATKQTWRAAHSAYRDWGRINLRLYPVVGTAATDIALCFLALPFTPRIVCTPWLASTVLAVICGLGVICVALLVWLIIGMVERPAD